MSVQIFICRHGETEWTLSGKHTSITDISLTETGRHQAALLGKRLRKISFDAVFSSPLKRAFETCQLAEIGQPILEPDAVEWNYGIYEGLTNPEIRKQHPNWTIFTQGAPQGESLADITLRADRLLHKLLAAGSTVALFSHGHFSRVLAARWLQLPAQQGKSFYLSVASLSLLGFEHQGHVLRLWNDTSHLDN